MSLEIGGRPVVSLYMGHNRVQTLYAGNHVVWSSDDPVVLTQGEYDSLDPKDPNATYIITEG